MRRPLALLVAAVSISACSGEPDKPDKAVGPERQTVTVAFRLADYDTAFYECEGAEGYSDLGPETPVTIRDGSGEVLGVGKLGDGKPSSNGVQAAYCDWTARVDVPAGEDFYAVEVADRGEMTVSADELAADGWTVSMSLGTL